MGFVTDYLYGHLAKLTQAAAILVWFDPVDHYGPFFSNLDLPGVTLDRYDGSFFALRRRIDPLLNAESPPRLLVYVPLDPAGPQYGQALIELTAAGIVLQPGAAEPAYNTRLSLVARAALLAHPDQTWTPDTAEEIARQIDAGQIATLAEADRAAEPGRGIPGVIPLLFESANAGEIALLLLSTLTRDEQITAKDALPALAALLGPAFGGSFPTDSPATLRAALARHILTTDLLAALAGDPPAGLGRIAVAPPSPARDACTRLAAVWRARRDLRDSYADTAAQVEADLDLTNLPLAVETIGDCVTFLAVETALQRGLEARFTAATPATWEDYTTWQAEIARRLGDFWSIWPERYDGVGARWGILHTALDLLFRADRLEAELRTVRGGPGALLLRYTDPGDQPWCLLDTAQRHLERQCHDFDFDPPGHHATLEALIARARGRYTAVADALANRFVHAYAEARFVLPELPPQRGVFARFVAPALKAGGKTAYVLVDALRFEMARELAGSLARDYEVQFTPVVGTAPTITDIGMAALLPGMEGQPRLVAAAPGKVALALDDTVLRDRAARLAWLRTQLAPRKVAVARLDDLLPKAKRALADELQAADLLLITSQEIDALGESDNPHRAHKEMGGILLELAKLINKLRDYGCAQIIITADHGYLFAGELESDMVLDSPGGQEADLHRRVWVGRGGTDNPAFLRAPLRAFGLGGDLEIAVPWGFGFFLARGGNSGGYVHGGLSPQELVVPVAVLTPRQAVLTAAPAQIAWTLELGSRVKRITTRVFSVRLGGGIETLIYGDLPRVRVEVRDKTGAVGSLLSVLYGELRLTGEVELRPDPDNAQRIDPNVVTVALDADSAPPTLTIALLDARTGRALAEIKDVAVSLSI